MTNKICITRDVDGNENVRKIVSLNPDEYEWKDFYEMLDKYAEYCFRMGEDYSEGNSDVYKTFKEWLDTEI